ncbi:magnesium transporter [Nitrogeniibacter mangrovi]|uniref:Magnesium transporter MgtE n=1 Tax=Nitrogeniibacter mangrovi TaxID=2016596 RepID=A0A6C1B810_9RHOO|nr:magnesium transporter [Nitrogeniibacter mangrovi]QID18858.1 magnesium transporter [Nitrogeniibacter mangrovi]
MDTAQLPTTDEAREQLLDALEHPDTGQLPALIARWHPALIADAVEALPRDMRHTLWDRLDAIDRGQVLIEVGRGVRQQLIDEAAQDELLAALATLEMDELADLDADLPVSVLDAMVRAMDVQRRERYERVKRYPDDTAGGLMDVDAAAVRGDVSLKAVLRYLRQVRKRDGKLPEHMDSLVVVDRQNRYLGMLRLSDLVSHKSTAIVSHLMDAEAPAIQVGTPDTRVARLFEDRDLMSAAVVDDDGHLLGRITIDDVVDVMRAEADGEVMRRAGLGEDTDMFAPVLSNAARRAVWLGVNLINAFVAAWVIGLFEASIDQVVALAVLMPVVASMGGVAGNQTLTLVTRAIALDQIGRGNAMALLFREVASGLLNGAFWAIVVAVVATAWFGNTQLGIVFGCALLINLITGATAGTLVPLLLERLGIDPALAGGVLLTAATDVVGFFSFLGLATLFLL